MRELIGKCTSCKKSVYCESGFFDGVQENGKLICSKCAYKKKEQ